MIDPRDERREMAGTARWLIGIAVLGLIAIGVWWITTRDAPESEAPERDAPAPETRDVPPPEVGAAQGLMKNSVL